MAFNTIRWGLDWQSLTKDSKKLNISIWKGWVHTGKMPWFRERNKFQNENSSMRKIKIYWKESGEMKSLTSGALIWVFNIFFSWSDWKWFMYWKDITVHRYLFQGLKMPQLKFYIRSEILVKVIHWFMTIVDIWNELPLQISFFLYFSGFTWHSPPQNNFLGTLIIPSIKFLLGFGGSKSQGLSPISMVLADQVILLPLLQMSQFHFLSRENAHFTLEWDEQIV